MVPLWEPKAGDRVETYDNLRDIAEAAREGATGLCQRFVPFNPDLAK